MGTEKLSAMLKGGGGGTQSFEVVLTWELKVLVILKGEGAQKLSTLKKRCGGGSFILS